MVSFSYRVAALTNDVKMLEARLHVAKTPAEDMMMSLNSLVKNNKGLFKSDRQAAFLYKASKRFKIAPALPGKSEIQAWGRAFMREPDAVLMMADALDPRFGRKDPTKIRWYGYAYVLDGAGVVARAKLKMRHETGQATGVKGTDWQRPANLDAPVLYDQGAAKKKLEQQVKKNQPIIDKIRSVPDYENIDILQSFLDQLLRGRELSPGQLGVLRKYVSVDVGDPAEWKKQYEEALSLIDKKLVKPALAVFRSGKIHESWDPGYYITEISQGWEKFKRKPQIDGDVSADLSELSRLAGDAGWKKPAGVTGMLDAVARLHQAAKKGQKAPRTALRALPAARKLLEWLRALSPKVIEGYWLKTFVGERPDPLRGWKP